MARILLPLVLVGALLSTALFFLLQSDGETGRRGSGPRTSRSPAEAPAPAPLPDLTAPSAPEEPVGLAERQGVEPPVEVSAADPAEDVPPGPDRLLGRVLDSQGNPVSGAEVVASNRRGIPLHGAMGIFGAEPLRMAVTDADGRFELAGLAAGTVSFGVRAPGFAPFERRDVPVSASPSFTLDPFVLSTGAILSGKVVGPDGVGLADVDLVPLVDREGPFRFFGRSGLPALATTGPDGAFRLDRLACGPYRILLRHPDHPEREVEGLAEIPGREIAGLVWRLEAGVRISGVAVDVPLEERGALEVRASKVGTEGAFGGGRTAEVDGSGRFTLRGLETETEYDLRLRRPRSDTMFGFERSRSVPVRARAGEEGVVLPYQSEAAVTFEVRDRSTNQPLTDFLVEAGLEWPQALRGEDGQRLRHHPEGRVRVGNLRPRSSEQKVMLRIEAAGFRGVERSDLTLGPAQELDLGVLYLDPIPLLRVTVTGDDGAPVEGARVQLSRESAGGFHGEDVTVDLHGGVDGEVTEVLGFGSGRSATTDARGVAVLSSYPGESCRLRVTAEDYAPYTEGGLALTSEARTEHGVTLDRGGEVLVTVLDADGVPLAGASIQHRGAGGASARVGFLSAPVSGPRRAVSDGEGQYLMRFLEDGMHGFKLKEGSGPGEGLFFVGDEGAGSAVSVGQGSGRGDWTEVLVVSGARAEVTLRASPRGSLAGNVREAGKRMAGASLTLREDKPGASQPQFGFPGMGGGGPRARTDGDGAYRFDDVVAGRYLVRVEHPTRRMPEEFAVEVRPGENRFDLDLSLSVIEGTVTDEAGEPLAGLKVEAQRASGSGQEEQGFAFIVEGADGVFTSGPAAGDPALTDASGRYSLRGVTPGVDLVVKVRGDGVQPATSESLQVAPDETRSRVDFTLSAGGTVEVEVLLADGTPATFCLITARPEGDPEAEPKTSFAQGGTSRLTGLAPGRWELSFQGMGPGGNGQDPVKETVEVRAREATPVTVRLP